jgi:hypothetical protein
VPVKETELVVISHPQQEILEIANCLEGAWAKNGLPSLGLPPLERAQYDGDGAGGWSEPRARPHIEPPPTVTHRERRVRHVHLIHRTLAGDEELVGAIILE